MGWFGDAVGGVAGFLGGGAGKVAGLLTGAGGSLLGGKAEDSVSGEAHPTVTGFDPGKTLGKDNALPGQNYFDDSIEKELIPEHFKRDEGYFSDVFNHGIDPNKGGELSVPGLMGDKNDAMVQAIQNRAKEQSGQSLRGITTRNEANAEMAKGTELSKAAQESAAVYQNQVQNFNQQYQYQMQRYQIQQQYKSAQAQAQASLWGSVFGGIGKIAGIAAAGA